MDLHVWFDLPDGRELHAVQGVGFDLDPRERIGLVGESGCGKTTTILALMGLLPLDATVAGESCLDGETSSQAARTTMRPHRWNDIAMVFQGAMNAFNPVKTVEHQIVEPMELHGTRERARRRRPRGGELLELSAFPPPRPAATRTSSRAGCASAPRSPWRWPASRRCCWPTSRRRRST